MIEKPYKSFDYTGKTVKIECPFCGTVVLAYVWSLAGSGKKCPCGAIHGYMGISRRKGDS
jgi:hypothetical protein